MGIIRTGNYVEFLAESYFNRNLDQDRDMAK